LSCTPARISGTKTPRDWITFGGYRTQVFTVVVWYIII
jgi:hypothetical protein